MAFSKDVERLARSLHGQRLEPDYIRHYLVETFQLEMKTIDELFDRLNIPRKSPSQKLAGKPAKGEEKKKPTRQGFY